MSPVTSATPVYSTDIWVFQYKRLNLR